MKAAIVTTTINVPEFFEGYCQDFVLHNHKDVCFVVIADKKTPVAAEQYCADLAKKHGFRVEYFDVERQKEYLSRFPELDAYLPYNSVQRRNIGMLFAYSEGCDPIITVDDDNFLHEKDLLKSHLQVGSKLTLKSYESPSGWMNPCQFLAMTPEIPIYHRGLPMSKRFAAAPLTATQRSGRVVVNVGMWIGDPDVDAWVRMTAPVEATQWNADQNFTLTGGTWAPFNSQQTAVARDVIPAYFLNPNAGRYDDIWASYILHRISNHLNDLISYGSPVVAHLQKRSLASLWRDMEDERLGTLLTDEFVSALRNTKLSGSTYVQCYVEIADALAVTAESDKLPTYQQAFLKEYVRGMRMWLATFARLVADPAPHAHLVK